MNFIELFAGCGGLSLGLKSAGYQLVMANELSPMAAETYAYNFFGEDFQLQASSNKNRLINNTYWLSSKYGYDNFKARLRENPYEYPELGQGISDLVGSKLPKKGGLIVGSIVDLNKWLSDNSDASNAFKCGFGDGSVDLISGGPPCQSFSMAGLRRQDCEKNSLPWEFAKLAQIVQPKLVLLENVTGILRPFKDEEGKSYYAWFELAKAFAAIGYIPLCLHTNAKFAGVPQNRPRFILIGVRQDFFTSLNLTFNAAEKQLFDQPFSFFKKILAGEDVDLVDLSYREVTKPLDFDLYRKSFLSPLVACENKFITVEDAIDDLREGSLSKGTFTKNLNKLFSKILPNCELKNHDYRSNNNLVKRRFRLYQVLSLIDKSISKQVVCVLKGESDEISNASWKVLSKYEYLSESGNYIKFKSKNQFLTFLNKHATKKQTQKALLPNQPAPAALSIPDDACHYHQDEQRTLTVREMARIQSFPDNFEFRSKVTTGGNQRRFEVPQYTQVGNAVPPILGRALGLALHSLLSRC